MRTDPTDRLDPRDRSDQGLSDLRRVMTTKPDVIVIGAGLAGLCCALRLQQGGRAVLLLEASDGPGGRVRTDRLEGFLLDRGFQVLLTGYPEAQKTLDLGALTLRPFYPGALVRYGGRFHRLADPWRRPLDAGKSLFSSIGTLTDKIHVSRLRARILAGTLEDLFQRPETTTLDALKKCHFSDKMIDRFFRPFLGGIFFDCELAFSSRMFEFVFRTFSEGDSVIPAGGMGAIPAQLASRLSPGTLRAGARVASLSEDGVILVSGESIPARVVVVATDGPEAARLLGDESQRPSRSVTTMYFAAEKTPLSEPLLVLNGEGKGPVNSFCVPSVIAPTYAPESRTLVSASTIGNPGESDAELEAAVRAQMREWFGRDVEGWRHLRTYRISHALTPQDPPLFNPIAPPVQVRPGVFTCGEYRSAASIQWAMFSGRMAAESILQGKEAL